MLFKPAATGHTKFAAMYIDHNVHACMRYSIANSLFIASGVLNVIYPLLKIVQLQCSFNSPWAKVIFLNLRADKGPSEKLSLQSTSEERTISL